MQYKSRAPTRIAEERNGDKTMKLFKRLFFLAAVCLFVFALTGFLSEVSQRSRLTDIHGAPAASQGGAYEGGYLVRCENNAIYVYTADGQRVVGVLDIRPSDLPQEDRRMLELGIMLENEQELLSLLEDYSS